MLPAVWAPSPDYKEAKSVIANYIEALTQGSAAASGCRFRRWVRGTGTSELGMITALLASGARFSRSDIADRILCAQVDSLRSNFLYGLQVAHGGTLPVYYNPTNRKSTMVATNDIGAEVATLLTGPARSGAARRRAWFDGHPG